MAADLPTKNDWRRNNVSAFVQQLGQTIKDRKPWVKFGVSPFGIYRKQKSDPVNGSATSGLQNYDDLYADVLLWVNKDGLTIACHNCIGRLAIQLPTTKHWPSGGINMLATDHSTLEKSVEKTVKEPDLKNPATNQIGG